MEGRLPVEDLGDLLGTGLSDDELVTAHDLHCAFCTPKSKCDLHSVLGQTCEMTDDKAKVIGWEREEPWFRLTHARNKAGFASAREAAEAMGVSPNTYAQHESGLRGFGSRVQRYAKFFRVAPEWLAFGTGNSTQSSPNPELTTLPILGQVQAGAWLALDDSDQTEPQHTQALVDHRFPYAKQWLREVRGDSMNARNILPGDVVHIVDLVDSGVRVNTGMIVEVVRLRDGGSLREITLKEAVVGPDGSIALWPRSTNPKWQSPVIIAEADNDDDIEVQITGFLVTKMTRFPLGAA